MLGDMNGQHAPLILPPTNFAFTEEALRGAIAQVNRVVGKSGGNIQVGDVACLLAIGILLDKVNTLTEKVDKLMTQQGINPAVTTKPQLIGAAK